MAGNSLEILLSYDENHLNGSTTVKYFSIETIQIIPNAILLVSGSEKPILRKVYPPVSHQ